MTPEQQALLLAQNFGVIPGELHHQLVNAQILCSRVDYNAQAEAFLSTAQFILS